MKNTGKVLGFDYGLARIGVAVGDVQTRTVQPLTTLRCRDGRPEWRRLEELCATWLPCCLVVGKPDERSPPRLLRHLQGFVSGLRRRLDLPVHAASETCTSNEAYALLKRRRRAIRKEEIDKAAAALIVEGWLADYAKTPCARRPRTPAPMNARGNPPKPRPARR